MFVTFNDPKTGEERDFELEMDDIDLVQARYIYRHFGLTVAAMSDGITELNAEALGAAYWLMLKQNGITVDPAKMNFKILKFGEALIDGRWREKASDFGISVERLRELAGEALEKGVTVDDLIAEERGEANPTEAEAPAT